MIAVAMPAARTAAGAARHVRAVHRHRASARSCSRASPISSRRCRRTSRRGRFDKTTWSRTASRTPTPGRVPQRRRHAEAALRGREPVGHLGQGARGDPRQDALGPAAAESRRVDPRDRRADLPAEHLDGQRHGPDVDGAGRAGAGQAGAATLTVTGAADAAKAGRAISPAGVMTAAATTAIDSQLRAKRCAGDMTGPRRCKSCARGNRR